LDIFGLDKLAFARDGTDLVLHDTLTIKDIPHVAMLLLLLRKYNEETKGPDKSTRRLD
jgi:hypothetical protein